MTRARRVAIAGMAIATMMATSGCGRRLAKGVTALGGAVSVGAMISTAARDCDQEGSCEVPRAEAFVLPVAIAVLLAGAIGIMVTQPAREPPPVATAAVPPPPPPPPAPPDPADLTERARYAARAGQCAAVVRLGARVAELDRAYHARSFVTDRAIARCLAPTAHPGHPAGQ